MVEEAYSIEGVPGISNPTVIGEGGFGRVYRAHQDDLGRDVAVKVLKFRPDEATLRRFRREVHALGSLSAHPNIVSLHAASVTDAGYPYMIMEYASGGSLQQHVRSRGPLGWRDAFELGVSICNALEVAHAQGVVHRDLKPANIFWSEHGMPLLGDFGIASLADATGTKTGAVSGTLAHASPEQLSGMHADARSDVYSLASTLYQLIDGHPAFLQPGDPELLTAIVGRIASDDPAPLGDTPPEAMEVIGRAMAKNPDQRTPDIARFARELEQALHPTSGARAGSAAVPAPPTPPQPAVAATNQPRRRPEQPNLPVDVVVGGARPAESSPALDSSPPAYARFATAPPTSSPPASGTADVDPPRTAGLWAIAAVLAILIVAAIVVLMGTSADSGSDVAEVASTTEEDEATDDPDDAGGALDDSTDEGEDVDGGDQDSDGDGEDADAADAPAEDPEPCRRPVNDGAGGGGELTVLQWEAPTEVDAYRASGRADVQATSLVLEPLANISPSGAIVPRLAAEVPSVENGGLSPDLRRITWTLLDCVFWSDGTPLTSEDVVFTWQYCVDPATGCTVSDAFDGVEDVQAVDDHTVEITFDAPMVYPFEPFVGHDSPIVQRAQFEECLGATVSICSRQDFSPIGTGPFMLTSFRSGDLAVYTMNPNYRGVSEGKPFFDDVVILGGGSAESTARTVLELGQADYAWNSRVAPVVLQEMLEDGRGSVAAAFTSAVEHLNLNQTNNRAAGNASSDHPGNPHPILFQRIELVQALSLAIDRELIAETGYGHVARPTCNMWHIRSQTSTRLDWCMRRDVDRANRILDDAGYVDTDNDGVRETPDGQPLSFSFATSVNAVRQSTQEIIASNWAEIGVAVDLLAVEAGLFFDATNTEESVWRFPTDIEMFANLPSTPSPENYLGDWTQDNIPTRAIAWGGSNIPRLQSDEFDDIIAQLEQLPFGDPLRDELAMRANDILSFEGGAVIPLLLRGSLSAFSDRVENVGPLNGWDSELWNVADWTRR